jgi:hypothetical protein
MGQLVRYTTGMMPRPVVGTPYKLNPVYPWLERRLVSTLEPMK